MGNVLDIVRDFVSPIQQRIPDIRPNYGERIQTQQGGRFAYHQANNWYYYDDVTTQTTQVVAEPPRPHQLAGRATSGAATIAQTPLSELNRWPMNNTYNKSLFVKCTCRAPT